MTPIALDAMGGDLAPTEVVAGAVAAAAEGLDVILVGDESRLKFELAALGADLPIVHAADNIHMTEDPARAVREKSEASINVAARMVRDGEAGAFVSAGSTGAALAAATVLIGRAPGVLRPTITSFFPTPGSPTLVLDCGANPEVKPEHILQFALMGSVASEVFYGVESPRVGLLNNGEEPGKGRALEKESYVLLSKASLNFIGNVEGRDLATDRADVIVTDGFVGNIFLKTTEGVAQMVLRMVMEEVGRLTLAHDVLGQVAGAIQPLSDRLDYEHTGGAHLLGANGVVVIAHGSSGRLAIANSLRQAGEGIERGLVAKITAQIAAL